MKKLFFLFFIAFSIKASTQSNDYTLSFEGIGPIKIGMTQAELEKLLNKKFILKNALDTAVSWNDSATVKYKRIEVMLFFQRAYTAENIYYMYLIGLRTSSLLCKTKAGVGIGAEKLKIVTAYEANNILMGPQYESEDAAAIKSKTKYLITIKNDTWDRRISFYLSNKKTVAIEVGIIFNDSE
jgi:hypothetical protein